MSETETAELSPGLQRTLQLLAATSNDAAVDLLAPALDSPHHAIGEQALRALLSRRSQRGKRLLVERWPSMSPRWREIVAERPGRLSTALRDALLGADAPRRHAACSAILDLADYDLAAPLIHLAEDVENPHAPLAAETLVGLCEKLYDEAQGPRDYRRRRDPKLVRSHLLGLCEDSARRFIKHRQVEMLRALLLLAGRDSTVVRAILTNPHDAAYLPLLGLLREEQRPGVLRLLLGCLDDPKTPMSVLHVVASRTDSEFLTLLTNKIGFEPSSKAATNLHRLDSIRWLQQHREVLLELPDAGQHAAVQVALASGMPRNEKLKLLAFLLEQGKPAGRRAAIGALAHFQGSDANGMTLAALDDDDPHVQAAAVGQLRERGLPGALGKLVQLLESPYGPVREAARGGLEEFQFDRYLASFDLLEEESRRSTGSLVKRVDPQAPRLVAAQLGSPSRASRLRALQMIAAMDFVERLEIELLASLEDEDHMVRAEAATTLATSQSPIVREALRGALNDRSVTVQKAAEDALLTAGARIAEEPLTPELAHKIAADLEGLAAGFAFPGDDCRSVPSSATSGEPC